MTKVGSNSTPKPNPAKEKILLLPLTNFVRKERERSQENKGRESSCLRQKRARQGYRKWTYSINSMIPSASKSSRVNRHSSPKATSRWSTMPPRRLFSKCRRAPLRARTCMPRSRSRTWKSTGPTTGLKWSEKCLKRMEVCFSILQRSLRCKHL